MFITFVQFAMLLFLVPWLLINEISRECEEIGVGFAVYDTKQGKRVKSYNGNQAMIILANIEQLPNLLNIQGDVSV